MIDMCSVVDRLVTGQLDEKPCCKDCKRALTAKEIKHGKDGYGHEQRCCTCFDRSCGKPE
jgi:hypothetical protein